MIGHLNLVSRDWFLDKAAERNCHVTTTYVTVAVLEQAVDVLKSLSVDVASLSAFDDGLVLLVPFKDESGYVPNNLKSSATSGFAIAPYVPYPEDLSRGGGE